MMESQAFPCAAPENNEDSTWGEITEVLSATKTAVRDTYGQNENVTYVISIVNSGTTAFNGSHIFLYPFIVFGFTIIYDCF